MEINKTTILIILFVLVVYLTKSENYCSFGKTEGFRIQHSDFLDVDTIHSEKTPYQKLNIINIRRPFPLGKCLILDNEVQLCEYDEHRYHEMIVHFPTRYIYNLQLKNVLIVGGGDLMTLREVMKYPTVENVFLLEIDKAVINNSVKYLGSNPYTRDPRVKIIINDARNSIDFLLREEIYFDMIIIDTTEDGDINTNIDDVNFYMKCKNMLKDRGILIKNGSDFFYDLLTDVFPYAFRYSFPMKAFESNYEFILCSRYNVLTYNICENESIFNEYINPKIKYYKPKMHNKYINWHNILNLYDIPSRTLMI
ncbi:putative spermidine synthase [Heterosigma akashiwo virus 01]|uniref:Putative spermidine synthase n=1 Tax=Heterosigma akashiwo virus 01 TaxID=97195 RepID=A0A1C9C533_HAV01|nr:putative spermidine synthase [Heterosigma akashiwo virus 01]AOM63396.1 putative spermidine synthase [Heterosigma akashiwo virus 01]